MIDERQQQIERLRQMETFIYQMAYYVLDGEQWAIEATQQTMKDAVVQAAFWQMDEPAQMAMIRELTIRSSIHIVLREKLGTA